MKRVSELKYIFVPKGQRAFRTKDGHLVPLYEMPYDMAYTCFKSDKKKAIVGDATACIEALGLCHMPHVIEAHVGSGKVAHVVMDGTWDHPYVHALRGTLPAKSCRVRDTFDQKGAPETQILKICSPTPGRTLDHHREIDNKRRDEIKAGIGKPLKKRTKPNRTRFHILGVPRRPRATIVKITSRKVEEMMRSVVV